MKAELKDGTIIQLEKDCGCMDEIHSAKVPHWVHMDEFDRRQNQRHMQRALAGDANGTRALIQGSIRRLEDKKYNLTSRGIVRLIPEEGDIL